MALPVAGTVLAYTGGKDHGVHASHNSGIGADELLHAVMEHIQSQSGPLIALRLCLLQITEVRGYAGDALGRRTSY